MGKQCLIRYLLCSCIEQRSRNHLVCILFKGRFFYLVYQKYRFWFSYLFRRDYMSIWHSGMGFSLKPIATWGQNGQVCPYMWENFLVYRSDHPPLCYSSKMMKVNVMKKKFWWPWSIWSAEVHKYWVSSLMVFFGAVLHIGSS